MSLHGRLALVTGGASGIGKATCHALAAQGVRVVVADLNVNAAKVVASELPGAGTHIAALLDVSDASSVDILFADIKETESIPISIVVNCAGITKRSPLVETTDEDFDKIIQVNLKGTFLVTRAAARAMIASGVTEGVVVNVASILGKSGLSGLVAYTASKGGIVALTKSVAQELAQQGIRCNAVLPSLTQTAMIDPLPEEPKRACIAQTPLARMCQPEEVSEAIVFLCSPRSSFVTGAALEVTGGFKM
ncbi:hypothetical protein HPB52_001301 [Rhipicephalus sanguineus]|uniref:(3R)-3-hydroxyacyl-CoA dehydrogenase n=2 Tax=Rhipicephalus sanguineus TaxID=34632 RepID=A0A9D4PY33_RHISA|nr:hypothetical protein HPB52_001301 [Rhipicephalus sanguineus]